MDTEQTPTTPCPRCEGKGTHAVVRNGWGYETEEPCPLCVGTGRVADSYPIPRFGGTRIIGVINYPGKGMFCDCGAKVEGELFPFLAEHIKTCPTYNRQEGKT